MTTDIIKCMCGCGEERLALDAKGRPRMFIHGHNRRGVLVYNRKPRNLIVCACGCDKEMLDRNAQGRLRRFISAHNMKGGLAHCLKPRNLIHCACGCGREMLDRDKHGNPHRYISGHNLRGIKSPHLTGDKHPRWKGGRTKHNGYPMIHISGHHRADLNGYVREHIVVYETHYNCWYITVGGCTS
jgi:hypothetical protein